MGSGCFLGNLAPTRGLRLGCGPYRGQHLGQSGLRQRQMPGFVAGWIWPGDCSACGGMLAIHLVAHLSIEGVDLRSGRFAPVLWRYLRSRFSRPVIAVVMPNHLHLVTPSLRPERDRFSLADLCGRFQRTVGLPSSSWERVPQPRLIHKRDELRRQFRYVALNECRAGLARDPLRAMWSTYRELFGAVADPWVDMNSVLADLGFRGAQGRERLHCYVSSDPSCAVDGTPLPGVRTGERSLERIVVAAAAATRAPVAAVRCRSPTRRAFVWLARSQGWDVTGPLAEICHCSGRAVRKIATHVDRRALAAAIACLADERLGGL